MLRKVIIFGATGSIGSSVLNVIREHSDKFQVVGVTANSNVEKLSNIAREFRVPNVGIFDENLLSQCVGLFSQGTKIFSSVSGFCEMAQCPDADSVVMAIVGTDGLLPTMAAIKAKKDILLASKEVLVIAGKFVMSSAREHGVCVLPIDSEHNAIFQCLQGNAHSAVDKLILTASGGPFRGFSSDQLLNVTVEQAMRHPTWNMGQKITIDSATLVNKGLEMIEARWLFDISGDNIDIIIHPESIIHSMVAFCDGAILAQMSHPTMEIPISYCLFYPERCHSHCTRIDFSTLGSLTFFPPDVDTFPAVVIAKRCLGSSSNSNASAVFQAANEVAVEKFLRNEIRFLQINDIISGTLDIYQGEAMACLDSCVETVTLAKITAKKVAQHL